MPEFSGHNDLRSYLRVLWRWKWLFLVLLLACPLAAYLLERGKPNVYQSQALVGVNEESVNTTLLNNGGGFSTTNVVAVAALVKTSPVADVAAGLMRPRANPTQIVKEVSASGNTVTNFVSISAQDRSPVRAAQIANAFAKAIGQNQQQAAVSQLDGAIAGIRAELKHLTRKDQTTRPTLEGQLTQLKAAIHGQSSQAAILQAAAPDYTPVGPHLRRTVELGFVIGLLLALGAVVLAESADRRMRSTDDLEDLTDLPLLASIAPSAFEKSSELDPVDEESFQMLRTSLTYFNVDQTLKSVLITSPGEQEGKTTVATHLAMAAARAGSRVILVDGDLRRAGVSGRLNLDEAASGLGPVLSRTTSPSEALVTVELPDDAAGQLRVLPAGPLPPNPAALMSSDRMQQLVKELESQADLVIIDSPAALAVSDAVPLMKAVSGVVLVARLNQSDQATVERLRRIVTSAHGTLLGVVATGVSSGQGYAQTRSYYTSRTRRGEQKPRFGRGQKEPSTNGHLIAPSDQRPVGSRPD